MLYFYSLLDLIRADFLTEISEFVYMYVKMTNNRCVHFFFCWMKYTFLLLFSTAYTASKVKASLSWTHQVSITIPSSSQTHDNQTCHYQLQEAQNTICYFLVKYENRCGYDVFTLIRQGEKEEMHINDSHYSQKPC